MGVALLAAPGQAHAPADGAGGVGDSYWPLDGNGGIDVQSYLIRDRYDFDTRRLEGSTVIRLRTTQELSSFSLDFLLPVKQVWVDGVRAPHSQSQRHELRITPAAGLPAGSLHRVLVHYAGKPDTERYAGERNWLANRHEVVTMNEPHMAPWWFPVNDHPSDKALVTMEITVPRGKQVVGNGRLDWRRSRGETTTWRWSAAEPMAPYLAFFAAGDFTIAKGSHDGLPWLVAVSRRLHPADQRASMKLMRRTPQVIDRLEDDLGPYPFSVTGGLTTSLQPGFALENQTRPIYPAVGAGAVWLVVHELAHQWFGDHVAVARWRDIWINEGFATFMEWRWEERTGGRTGAEILESAHAATPASSTFWSVTVGDPGPDNLFSGAVYDRGAMTLQALRNRVGDEVFWRLLRTWIAEQGGGNATSEEFEELAARISGQDLTGFFAAWLRTPAKPASTSANGLG